jgi:hypothetical protein
MKKVSIIILNWNGRENLRNCLNSIKRNTGYPAYEVIVVDQGSTDGSVEMLEGEFPWVRVIKNPRNYGIPRGTNQAFEIAEGDYFFILGNDTLVAEGWLENAVKIMESDPRISTVGSTQISFESYYSKNYKPRSIVRQRANVNSVGMLIKRKVYERIGGYDEANFSPYGGDETDWNFRAANLGYCIVEAGNVIIAHLHSSDTKKQNPEQRLLLETHRLQAYLYNLSFFQFLKRIPGLFLIFLNSLKEGTTRIILRSYWLNIRNWRNILREKKRREEITRKLKEEQLKIGGEWF